MKYTVSKSDIQGKGLFAKQGYKKGEIIGLSHVDNKPTGTIGKYHNHSDKPTAVNIKKGNQRFLIANTDIPAGVEITTNYRRQPELEQPEDFKKFQKGGEENCEDGRCLETDQAQELLDKADELRYKSLGNTWDVTEKANPENQAPLNAKTIWEKKGVKSLESRLGVPNPANCMWAAGSGYQCVPELKGKLPLTPFESNDKFINAVNKGTTPFRRVDVTQDPNFATNDANILRPGDIINMKGPKTSHAMTFSHYREDGVPIFLDSNGEASNMGWNQGLIPGMVPGKNGVKGYVSRLDPEAVYKNEIKALEEKARTNPTYYEDGGSLELDLTPEQIQEYAEGGYIIEDISVPTLNHFDNGGEPKRKKERFVEGTYDPNETAGYILTEDEVVVPGEASAWGKARTQYKKQHPEEKFIERKKKQYLKRNPGLNKLYGVSMNNFPEDVETNFRNEYDYKTNTAVVKKVGRKEGWNPNKRDQYIDDLNDTQRSIVADSKYGSKLQAGYWNRALAGVQELGNTLLPGKPFKYNIPGLTKREQKEIRNDDFGAFEVFAPTDIPGVVTANFLKNRGLTTGSDYKDLPALYSGEKMSNVSDIEAMAFNPLTYYELPALPGAAAKMIRAGAKGLKALPGAVKASKESGLLSNTYKINPFAGRQGYKDVPKELPGSPNTAFFNDLPNSEIPQINPRTGLLQVNNTTMLSSTLPRKFVETHIPDFKSAEGLSEDMLPYLLPREELMKRYPFDYMSKDELIGQSFKSGLRKVEFPEEIPASFNTQEDIWARALGKPLPKRVSRASQEPKIYYDLNGDILDQPLKSGFINPFEIADAIIPNVDPFQVTQANSLLDFSPLNFIPIGKQLRTKGNAYRKFGNTLKYVQESKSLSPKGGILPRIGKKQIEAEGNWAALNEPWEKYPGAFTAEFDFKAPGSNLGYRNPSNRAGVLITDADKKTLPDIPLTDPGLSFHRRLPFSNRYIPIDKQKLLDNKFQMATQGAHLQSLAEKYGYGLAYAGLLGAMGNDEAIETYDKYTIDPVIKEAKKLLKLDSKKEKDGGVIEIELSDAELEEYIQGGYIIEKIQ